MDGTPELLLAVDVGTTTTKAVVFDLRGTVVAVASRQTPVDFAAPGRAEYAAEDSWRAAAACVREALAGLDPGRVAAVGTCGFMHTLVPVAADGRALGPVLVWPDQRCTEEVRRLLGSADVVRRVTGRELTTMSSLPRLLWLQRHAPEVPATARAYLLPKDFVRFRLTGVLATDQRDAHGTGLVDAGGQGWSEELTALVGVDVAAMPPIRRPDEIVGAVSPEASAATGLLAGTPVAVGTGDWPATLLGSGCHLPDRLCLYLGSAGILGSFASAAALDRFGETRYFGSVTSTGTALRWVRDLLCQGMRPVPSYDDLIAEAAGSEPGAAGVLFLPHLMGERGGGMRPNARGTLYGLTLGHRRSDILRAVLEGTIAWLRMVFERYPVDGEQDRRGDLVVLGGGARSPLWRQICAAVFRRRLLLCRQPEGAAAGAAMLAAVAAGLADGYLELARDWSAVTAAEEPDPRLVAAYEPVCEAYDRLERSLIPLEETTRLAAPGRLEPLRA